MPSNYFPVYFMPDVDPAWSVNPGVLVDVSNAIPSKRKTLKTYNCDPDNAFKFNAATLGTPLYGEIRKNTDGGVRLLVGTNTKLLEHINNFGWADRSFASGSYPTSSNWTFTTFGNNYIACSKAVVPQVSVLDEFSALSGSPPKAACCTTQKNFVLLGDTNDGTNLPDRIWWSALGDHTSWTPSAATQAGNYRLLDTPGPVRCLANLRDSVVAYKDDSLYLGQYEGSPLLWTWRLISDRVGCASPQGVASVDGAHYFLHKTGVYRFDGASVSLVGSGANRYLLAKMGADNSFFSGFATVQAAYDEHEGTIYWYFRDSASPVSLERRYALCYNVYTGLFGFVSSAWSVSGACHGIVRASAGDLSYWSSSLNSATTNIMTVGVVNVGDAKDGSVRVPRFSFDAESPGAMSITTGAIGDEDKVRTITRVKPRFLAITSLTSGSVLGKMYGGGAYDAGTAFAADNNRFRYDGMKTGRWLSFVGSWQDAELHGLNIQFTDTVSDE